MEGTEAQTKTIWQTRKKATVKKKEKKTQAKKTKKKAKDAPTA